MSDPWQEEAEAEDDWQEELPDPVEGSLFEPDELDAEEDEDLWPDELDDAEDDSA